MIRILVGVGVLAFAGVADLRWRRAPDACWLIVACVGIVLLAADWASTPSFWAFHQAALITAALVFVMALVGYITGLIAGGADAKALASLAILAPLPLGAAWSLPLSPPLPLVLTSLTNGLILALSVPLVLLVWNIAHGDVDGARTLLGFKRPLEKVDLRVAWPLEFVDEEGEHVVAATPRGVPRDAFDPDAMAEHGHERVWVTPKVPFLVPLWLGFVLAVLVGDPFTTALEAILA